MEETTVIFRSSETAELKIAEALYIQQEAPTINNQREGEVRILNVFQWNLYFMFTNYLEHFIQHFYTSQ